MLRWRAFWAFFFERNAVKAGPGESAVMKAGPIGPVEFAVVEIRRGRTDVNASWKYLRDDDASTIAAAAAESTVLRVLSLHCNRIGNEGASALASALAKSTSLETITLGRNRIGDEGAKALASALEKSTSVISVYIYENEIGIDGVIALANAVERSQSVRLVSVSYHPAAPAQQLIERAFCMRFSRHAVCALCCDPSGPVHHFLAKDGDRALATRVIQFLLLSLS